LRRCMRGMRCGLGFGRWSFLRGSFGYWAKAGTLNCKPRLPPTSTMPSSASPQRLMAYSAFMSTLDELSRSSQQVNLKPFDIKLSMTLNGILARNPRPTCRNMILKYQLFMN
jgi:hypothetical protein